MCSKNRKEFKNNNFSPIFRNLNTVKNFSLLKDFIFDKQLYKFFDNSEDYS